MTTTTYHRDNTCTIWNVYTQQWERGDSFADEVLASLGWQTRARVMRHTANIMLSQIEALRAEAGAAGDRKMVAVCDRALAGSKAARRACEDVILGLD